MDIRTNIINDYTAEVIIDGRRVYTLVDNNIRSQKAEERLNKKIEFIEKRVKFGKFLQCGAVLLGLTAFFYLLLIAGHSDFCTMVQGPDDWTNVQYFWRILYGIVCMGLAVIIDRIGSSIVHHP